MTLWCKPGYHLIPGPFHLPTLKLRPSPLSSCTDLPRCLARGASDSVCLSVSGLCQLSIESPRLMRVGAQVRTACLLFQSLDLAPSWGWRDFGFSEQGDIWAVSVLCLLLTSCSGHHQFRPSELLGLHPEAESLDHNSDFNFGGATTLLSTVATQLSVLTRAPPASHLVLAYT